MIRVSCAVHSLARALTLVLVGAHLEAAPWLVITEVHYHPPQGDQLEFVEIHNVDPPRIDLGGWSLDGEIRFHFPADAVIEPGAYLVVARDPEAVLRHFRGLPGCVGPFSGKLDNSGGTIILRNPEGGVIASCRYDRSSGWPVTPDGSGHTLSLIDPLLDPSSSRSWAASPLLGGTPGRPNGFRRSVAGVLGESLAPDPGLGPPRYPRINEVCLAPNGPDGAGGCHVEIVNPTPTELSLSGFHLSDDPLTLRKVTIDAGTPVPPSGHLVLRGDSLGPLRLDAADVALFLARPDGKEVVDLVRLRAPRIEEPAAAAGDGEGGSSPDSQRAEAGAGPTPVAAIRGRVPDGSDAWIALEAGSPGEANVVERTTDLVINEIMYHPVSESTTDEYIEIHHRGSGTFRLEGYRLTGGVRFKFGSDDVIGSGGYIVVARDPDTIRRRYGLSSRAVTGPWRGVLSNGRERLTLRNPRGVVVDEVEYGDSSPWPRWPDGRASSLELVHPDLDNSLAGSWQASDERSKTRWETFRYIKEHRAFQGRNLTEFQLILLEEGECLIDDLRLRGRAELIPDGSFERGGAAWEAMGTHARSGVIEESSARGRHCYRLSADGRGSPRHNYVSLAIPGGLDPGQKYMVSFRARWQRGSPLLLTRTAGQGIARTHTLEIPEKLGTPGARNSVWEAVPRPVVGDVHQSPIVPGEAESVRITARLSDIREVAGATLHYRRDGEANWLESTMQRTAGTDRAGTWSGIIPGNLVGQMEFYISARSVEKRTGTFPRGAPMISAQYVVGAELDSRLPSYTLLVSSRTWEEMNAARRMSQSLWDATLVYGNSRIFYNVGFRRRGSPWTRGRDNWRVVFGHDSLDGRRSLTIDGQGGNGTRLNERLTYYLIDRLRAPTVRQRYVHFSIPGRERGIYEDTEKVDSDFLSRWFPSTGRRENPAPASSLADVARMVERRGYLHKVDDYFELLPDGRRMFVESQFHFTSTDPEDYRWNFPPRANGLYEDFRPLMEMIHLLDPGTTPDRAFVRQVAEKLDVDEWLRVLAVRTFVNDWDTIGRERGKNALLFLPHRESRWQLLPWDCDLSWGRSPSSPLVSTKFPAIQRLLDVPYHRELFDSYLAYLADHLATPEVLGPVLDDFSDTIGASTSRHRQFAERRRAFVLSQLPARPFRVLSRRRVRRQDAPDLLTVQGVAPLIVQRMSLDGRPGKFLRDRVKPGRWQAEFEVGPEGGEAELIVQNFGGKELHRTTVDVPSRSDALALGDPGPAPGIFIAELVAPEEPTAREGDPAGSSRGGGSSTSSSPDTEEAGAKEAERSGEASDVVRQDEATGAPSGGEPAGSGDGEPVPAVAVSRRPASGQVTSAVFRALMEGEDGEGVPGSRDASLRSRAERRRADTRRSPWWETGERRVGEARPEARTRRPVTTDWREPEEEAGGGRTGLWLRLLVPALVLLGLAQLVLLKTGRARQAAASRVKKAPPTRSPSSASTPSPGHASGRERPSGARPDAESPGPDPAPPPRGGLREALAGSDPRAAARIFQSLWKSPGSRVPLLLELLEDGRLSPIAKIRQGPRGLTFLPASGENRGIPVRRLAELVLERALGGRPEASEPTRADWEALWRSKGPDQGFSGASLDT